MRKAMIFGNAYLFSALPKSHWRQKHLPITLIVSGRAQKNARCAAAKTQQNTAKNIDL
jgi:hypothetical protein